MSAVFAQSPTPGRSVVRVLAGRCAHLGAAVLSPLVLPPSCLSGWTRRWQRRRPFLWPLTGRSSRVVLLASCAPGREDTWAWGHARHGRTSAPRAARTVLPASTGCDSADTEMTRCVPAVPEWQTPSSGGVCTPVRLSLASCWHLPAPSPVPSRKEGRLPGGPHCPGRPERRVAAEPSGSEMGLTPGPRTSLGSAAPVFGPSGVVPAQAWDPLCP